MLGLLAALITETVSTMFITGATGLGLNEALIASVSERALEILSLHGNASDEQGLNAAIMEALAEVEGLLTPEERARILLSAGKQAQALMIDPDILEKKRPHSYLPGLAGGDGDMGEIDPREMGM